MTNFRDEVEIHVDRVLIGKVSLVCCFGSLQHYRIYPDLAEVISHAVLKYSLVSINNRLWFVMVPISYDKEEPSFALSCLCHASLEVSLTKYLS